MADLATLQQQLSPSCSILFDPSSPEFKEHQSRWTDIGKETPAAIVVLTSEEDVSRFVRSLLPLALLASPTPNHVLLDLTSS